MWLLIERVRTYCKHPAWESHLNGIKLHHLKRVFLDHSIVLTVWPLAQPDPCSLVDPWGTTPPFTLGCEPTVTIGRWAVQLSLSICSFSYWTPCWPLTWALYFSLSHPSSSTSFIPLHYVWPRAPNTSQNHSYLLMLGPICCIPQVTSQGVLRCCLGLLHTHVSTVCPFLCCISVQKFSE